MKHASTCTQMYHAGFSNLYKDDSICCEAPSVTALPRFLSSSMRAMSTSYLYHYRPSNLLVVMGVKGEAPVLFAAEQCA